MVGGLGELLSLVEKLTVRASAALILSVNWVESLPLVEEAVTVTL